MCVCVCEGECDHMNIYVCCKLLEEYAWLLGRAEESHGDERGSLQLSGLPGRDFSEMPTAYQDQTAGSTRIHIMPSVSCPRLKQTLIWIQLTLTMDEFSSLIKQISCACRKLGTLKYQASAGIGGKITARQVFCMIYERMYLASHSLK